VRLMTPLLFLFCWRNAGRQSTNDLIDAATLPVLISELIRNVIRHTKLWSREKLDVAEELIAHFSDGLEAGHTPAELLKDFGDQKQASKLIRRAKLRNRPVWWKVQKQCLLALLFMTSVYILIAIWLMTEKLNVSVNYVEVLNEPARSVGESDRAWPIYREAWSHFVSRSGNRFDKTAERLLGAIRAGDTTTWNEAYAVIETNKVFLEKIRDGSKKRQLGFVVAAQHWEFAPEDVHFLYGNAYEDRRPGEQAESFKAQSALSNEPVISVFLPHLSYMRVMARYLALDMRVAARQKDSQRFLSDLRALYGLANQCRGHSVRICELVALSIVRLANEQVGEVLFEESNALSDADLQFLIKTMTELDSYDTLQIAFEREITLDLLQRIYSSNGSVTVEGFKFYTSVESLFFHDAYPEVWMPRGSVWDEVGLRAMLPMVNFFAPDRHAAESEYHRLMDLGEEHASQPLWQQLHGPSDLAQALQEHEQSRLDRVRFRLLFHILPEFMDIGLAMKSTIAHRDAVCVAIAIELYRRECGHYPASLEHLVPVYLNDRPLDHSTGKSLLYKLVDGRPLLYGRGIDGDDDSGLPVKVTEESGWPIVPTEGDGDWVLWPRRTFTNGRS